jgi:hypothetical protein
LDGRTVSLEGYRFGYQGSEKDNEFKGEGNSYTTEFRQLDTRLGRWLSVDPVIQPWQSSYSSMDNGCIGRNDVLGKKSSDWVGKETIDAKGKKTMNYSWVNKSFSNKEEALSQGYDEWLGKSGLLENGILSKGDKVTYTGPISLFEDGTYKPGNYFDQPVIESSESNFNLTGNLNIVSPEEATLFYLKKEREERQADNARTSSYFKFSNAASKIVYAGIVIVGTGGSAVEASSLTGLGYAAYNGTSNFITQYCLNQNFGEIDYASSALSFGTSLFINPWFGAGVNTAFDAAIDLKGNGEVEIGLINKGYEKVASDFFFGGISNYSNTTLSNIHLEGVNKNVIGFRNTIMSTGSQALNYEVNKQLDK